MAKQRRWTCPRCPRPGVLAPGKMRTDDVRRYCLPCSEETGRLVARVCPALDTERQAREERRRERQKAARARQAAKERAKYTLADGTDVRELVRRAQGLRAWRRQSERCADLVRRADVDLVIGNPRGSHGRAWRRRVHVHLRKDVHPSWAMAIIVHELAHVGAPGHHHDRFFWSLWLDAMQEVYPTLHVRETALWANAGRARESGQYGRYGHYALEWANRELLEEVHDAD